MSLHEYRASRDLVASDAPFYALIMAAIARADTANGMKLRAVFPAVWAEVQDRYNAPGGILPEDLAPDDEGC